MESRKQKILTLKVNNFLILALDIVALVRYKKGKDKQKSYNTGQITRMLATTANSLGILYLEEQERQEKRQKHNDKIVKDFSHTLNKTKGDK
ncbi:hypothetical protein vBSauS24_105 [Staphylococcus phage vB_Sau_S24]|nr:hypothetical protein vBSauS24_105 [Staphylococcus phage vB_Sau_S24]